MDTDLDDIRRMIENLPYEDKKHDGVCLDIQDLNEEYTNYVNILKEFFNHYFPQFSNKLTIRCFKKKHVDEYRLFVNSYEDCLINALQKCLTWKYACNYSLELSIDQFNPSWDNDEKSNQFNKEILKYYQGNYDHFMKFLNKYTNKFDTFHDSVKSLPTDLSLHICSFLYNNNYGKFYVQLQEILKENKIDSIDSALLRQRKIMDFETKFRTIIYP